jgi:hypothetical protein
MEDMQESEYVAPRQMGPVMAVPGALVQHRAKRPKSKRFGLTLKVKAAIDYLVWGHENENVDLNMAAQLAGLSEKGFKEAITKPIVLEYYRKTMAALRNGERGNNFRTAVQIRDDKSLAKSATGQRVRLQAVQLLDADLTPQPAGQGSGSGVTVNVVIPGYVWDLREVDAPKPVQQIEHLDAHVPSALISLEDVQK